MPKTKTNDKARMASLLTLSPEALRARYRETTGKKPVGVSRDRMVKEILATAPPTLVIPAGTKTVGQVIDEVLGAHEAAHKQVATARVDCAASPYEAPTAPKRVRDPRLPPAGETIRKTYKGRELAVEVLESGFRHDGREWRSLTAIAMHVTGAASINGPLFFGIAKRGATAPPAPSSAPAEDAPAPAPRTKRGAPKAARKLRSATKAKRAGKGKTTKRRD